MEPKNLVKENLFSKGELFLDNVEYIGPYNIKADGTYHTLARFITVNLKNLKLNNQPCIKSYLKSMVVKTYLIKTDKWLTIQLYLQMKITQRDFTQDTF